MLYCVYHRLGEQSTFENGNEIHSVMKNLISELLQPEAQGDDEHDSVGVFRDGSGISVRKSGLVTFFSLEEGIEDKYLRDVPDIDLVRLMSALAIGDLAVVRSAKWVDLNALAEYKQDFYST
jgi:hypothetical protein